LITNLNQQINQKIQSIVKMYQDSNRQPIERIKLKKVALQSAKGASGHQINEIQNNIE